MYWPIALIMAVLGIMTWNTEWSMFFWLVALVMIVLAWHSGWFATLDDDKKFDIRKSDKR